MVAREQITDLSDGLRVLAPAKINLSLLITGKRPDGFHEIETIMAKVDLFDEVLIQPGQKSGIELVCKGPYWAPQGKENLAYKACDMLLKKSPSRTDIRITLTKNIPAGSGLGSASSDAAATLIGVNKYLGLNLPEPQLAELAAALGSDVAFFLGGPLAFCTGKGEKIKKLTENFNFSALLLLPDVSVSTKKVYANYNHNPTIYQNLSAQINRHLEKNRIDLASKMCANMLETSCFSLYKELFDLKAKVESLGIAPLCLSGSGSAMFCIIEDTEDKTVRENKHKLLEKTGCESIIVSNNGW
ncbi:MAG: 4-(cytidine 5'-diphospho)-2-C-methyl-D-erythritol kinase [Planctomycetota bacterium]|nr:MAG: 4-(cytidine 5'-diphospho)-2-C-methyl-D-erythritol kinase [Planctomycetota bacterium]